MSQGIAASNYEADEKEAAIIRAARLPPLALAMVRVCSSVAVCSSTSRRARVVRPTACAGAARRHRLT